MYTTSPSAVASAISSDRLSNTLTLYIDSTKQLSVKLPYLKSGIYTLCVGKGAGTLCEMRVWSYARSHAEIMSTMLIAIPPTRVHEHCGLRLSWFPLRRGGRVYPEGSLLYDTWARKPVGHRIDYEMDLPTRDESAPVRIETYCRWPCALPPALSTPWRMHLAPHNSHMNIANIERWRSWRTHRLYRPSIQERNGPH